MLHTNEKERTMIPCNNVNDYHRHGAGGKRKKKPDIKGYKLCFHLHKVQEEASYSTVIEVTLGLIFEGDGKWLSTAVGNVLYLDLGGGNMEAFLYVKIHQVIHLIFVHLHYKHKMYLNILYRNI